MKKIISIFLIICLLLMPVINNVYAIDNSFSSVFGGLGKEALAFMTVTTGLGITFATQNDAIEMFNDLRISAPGVIANMIDVVKDSWLGAYSTVSTKLISLKEDVYNYLVGKFGTLNVGTNVISGTITIADSTKHILSNSWPGVGDDFVKEIVFNLNNKIYYCKIEKIYRTYYLYNLAGSLIFTKQRTYSTENIYTLFFENDTLYMTIDTPATTVDAVIEKLSIPSFSISSYVSQPSLSLNISSDAGVIDTNFDPDNRAPVILPPPYVPGLDLKNVSNPNGSISKHFDGTIDDYIEHASDNNTWSDVQQYLNTGTNTTTLTQTDTGLNVGSVSDVPYPDTNIDVPDVLTGIGTIGGLIQAVINWLSQLANSIANIFAIPTDLTLNFDSLRLVDFKNKFPFSIPWDFYRAVKLFAKAPSTPNLAIDLDTDFFTIYHQIDLTRISLPIMFARYTSIVFFVIFLITKTRDLIKW